MSDLAALAATIRAAPGLAAKRDLALVAERFVGVDGEDAALLGDGLVVGGEAISPDLLTSDPFGAGAAAVVTNVADVRAMGARPLALVDTLVSPDRAHAAAVLDGLAWAAELHGVPVVGGHLTIGAPAALSAFCLEGRYRSAAPFFTSLRDRSPAQLRDDGEALPEVAERRLCHAARDVSMPGVAGSLLQLLELAACGATLDLDRLPRPDGVPLERWLVTFPSFGFVLAAPAARADEACAVFTARGLACAECGAFDATRTLRITAHGRTATVWDLAQTPLTRLGR